MWTEQPVPLAHEQGGRSPSGFWVGGRCLWGRRWAGWQTASLRSAVLGPTGHTAGCRCSRGRGAAWGELGAGIASPENPPQGGGRGCVRAAPRSPLCRSPRPARGLLGWDEGLAGQSSRTLVPHSNDGDFGACGYRSTFPTRVGQGRPRPPRPVLRRSAWRDGRRGGDQERLPRSQRGGEGGHAWPRSSVGSPTPQLLNSKVVPRQRRPHPHREG